MRERETDIHYRLIINNIIAVCFEFFVIRLCSLMLIPYQRLAIKPFFASIAQNIIELKNADLCIRQ